MGRVDQCVALLHECVSVRSVHRAAKLPRGGEAVVSFQDS